jgi:DNA oxidative demethylase
MAGQADLFATDQRDREIAPGAMLLGGFALARGEALLEAIAGITRRAPFRNMVTPGGWSMSVAMTNCGAWGWVTDRSGYRYDAIDPETGKPWPAMPKLFRAFAAEAAARAGFPGFVPDACLINRYAPGSKLSLHQDRDEQDYAHPIVSVSLGLPATFLFGGAKRSERPRRIPVVDGDVVVWGGPARLFFHGVDTLRAGDHPATGAWRYNLTLRRAR